MKDTRETSPAMVESSGLSPFWSLIDIYNSLQGSKVGILPQTKDKIQGEEPQFNAGE